MLICVIHSLMNVELLSPAAAVTSICCHLQLLSLPSVVTCSCCHFHCCHLQLLSLLSAVSCSCCQFYLLSPVAAVTFICCHLQLLSLLSAVTCSCCQFYLLSPAAAVTCTWHPFLPLLLTLSVMYIEHAMYCCSAEFYQTPGAIQYITDTVFTEAMDPYRLKIALNIHCYDSICCSVVAC